MSILVASTLLQQRSFTGDWLVSGDTLDLPQGVVTDLMITTTSPAPVYLGKLTIHDNTLFISFEQNGAICAYGEIRGDLVTQALETSGPVVSASITTGSLAGMAETSYAPYEAMVAPELVTVIGDMSEGSAELTIVQNGASTSYILAGDVILDTDSSLTTSYANGVVTVGVTDVSYKNFIQVTYPLFAGGATNLTSVNNVKAPSGIISITIATNGVTLPAVSEGSIISLDGRNINLCGTPRDLIDDKISPKTHSENIYKPLDDMYVKTGNTWRREAKRAVAWSYGLSNVELTEIDPNIDRASSESSGS